MEGILVEWSGKIIWTDNLVWRLYCTYFWGFFYFFFVLFFLFSFLSSFLFLFSVSFFFLISFSFFLCFVVLGLFEAPISCAKKQTGIV